MAEKSPSFWWLWWLWGYVVGHIPFVVNTDNLSVTPLQPLNDLLVLLLTKSQLGRVRIISAYYDLARLTNIVIAVHTLLVI